MAGANHKEATAPLRPRCTRRARRALLPTPSPMSQGLLPLTECNPSPLCVLLHASDNHRGRAAHGNRVQRPAERGVVGVFCRMVGPRLQGFGTGACARLASSAPRVHESRGLAAEASHACREGGAGASADVAKALLFNGVRGVAECPTSRACAMQCEQIRAA